MKLIICICFLVVVLEPCARAKSFNFDNFFLGPNKKTVDSDLAIPPAESKKNPFYKEPLDYSTEDESEAFNSSENVFDFDYQNVSSDSLDVSVRNEPDNAPSVSDNTTDPVVQPVAAMQNNESQPSEKDETTTSAPSTTTSEKTPTLSEVPPTANVSKESPTTVAGEKEEVVLGTTTGATAVLVSKTFYQRSIDWMEDAYTLSILMPITAGVLFATTIIVIVALCRCVRRCCRRRSFKRKPLPDSVKNLRPSDRARLLGDTSDEEF